MVNNKYSLHTSAQHKKVALQKYGPTNQVLATILYHDIFNFPLTREEVEKYLIGNKKLPKRQMHAQLQQKLIAHKKNYYFLTGKDFLVEERQKNEIHSKRKIAKAKKIAKFLGNIPTILGIGISGSLSMYNAKENDDIDLFIVTKAKTLWISRLLVIITLLFRNNLRTYGNTKVKDSICTNMWIDKAHMQFPKQRRNVYTAHEIAQMQMIFEKEGIHRKFISANAWIEAFLPKIHVKRIKNNTFDSFNIFQILEPFARILQLLYMKNHRTSETITDGFVAFHPNDYTPKILRAWRKQLQTYDI